MDQQTKAALKQDNFITTTSHGLEWAKENRKSVIVTVSLLLAVIIILVAVGVIYTQRSNAAETAFGEAMQVYQAPVAIAGQPAMPGVKTYANVAERATAANKLFANVADHYGMTKDGKNARYFAGLTAAEAGQTQTAETTLKAVADGFDKDLANLAKLALADLYRQTGRDGQAVDLYNQLAAKPTNTVPAATAQIALAEMYTAEGKTEQARKIYAQLKDKDAKGVGGVLAAQKLNPAAATGPSLQQ
ncbi:tetratricopeptide repeat protein [Granulicella tundricola]|uniref:tetratricopeptide repeat protein n=1 Tax=Granulicella tundricola TaxID=940615 RepID=UPI0002D2AF68|nr:tetratricopeptide repeat protein [Granulicella tundricola]